MSRLITSIQQLAQYLITKGVDPVLAGVGDTSMPTNSFPLRLSTYYANLIDWSNPVDSLRLMVMPQPEEETILPNELTDPIGDQDREAVPGLIHRYPDRCLLLLTTNCRIHCRFCFRRDVVGTGRAANLAAIMDYLANHTEVEEIIFSGGDPLTLSIQQLEPLLQSFGKLHHIKRIRFHSRIPAVDPDSVTPAFIELLGRIPQQVVLAVHINHPNEVTPAFLTLCQALQTAGVLIVSQTVLLKGVNASAEVLGLLFTTLTNSGIRPYYLHHLDQAQGTSHFRVSIKEGLELYQTVARRISRLCLPEYVLDLPGGAGKVPIRELTGVEPGKYAAHTFENKTVIYTDPARPARN